MPKLKSCLCGGKARIYIDHANWPPTGKVKIKCMKCGATTPALSSKEAIAAWARLAAGDWISVEDGLPSCGQSVLIQAVDGSIYKAIFLPHCIRPHTHWQEISNTIRYFADDFVASWQILPEPPQGKSPKDKIIQDLIDEAWGALAWINGTVQLSDRARAYKVKKLSEALEAAEGIE